MRRMGSHSRAAARVAARTRPGPLIAALVVAAACVAVQDGPAVAVPSGRAAAAWSGAPAAPPVRAAGTVTGWRLAYSDDFTGGNLGQPWGEYGGAYTAGATAWRASEVSVSGGLLRLKLERRETGGYPYTAGGVGMWGLAQTYGRYEFDAQAPTSKGIDSYATLWPVSDSNSDATLVELLAHPAVPPGVEAAYLTIGYGSGTDGLTVPGHYTDGFHHYRIEWTPQQEAIAVDGTVLLRSARVSHAQRWLGFVMSNGDNLTGVPSASTPLPAEFLIRNVRVYAYAPHAAQPVVKVAPPAHKAAARSARPSPRPSPSASPLPVATGSPNSASAAALASRSKGGALPMAAVWIAAGLAVVLAGGGALAWWGRARRRAYHSPLQ